MLKSPQFLIRYANNKMTRIEKNTLMQEEFKIKKMQEITTFIRLYELGNITLDETMENIAKI